MLIRLVLLLASAVHLVSGQIGPLSFESEKECGSPLMESNIWQSLTGSLASVARDGRIRVQLEGATGRKRKVLVRIVGLKVKDRRGFHSFLQQRLGQTVDLLVDHSDWDRQPKGLVASVRLAGESDLGLQLIRKGLASYSERPPYKMSRHLACLYRLEVRRNAWYDGTKMKCLKCGSENVISNAKLMDRGHGNSDAGDLSLVLYDDPKAWFFPGAHNFPLKAHVCCSCGFTELYAADPGGLLAASRKVPPQS